MWERRRQEWKTGNVTSAVPPSHAFCSTLVQKCAVSRAARVQPSSAASVPCLQFTLAGGVQGSEGGRPPRGDRLREGHPQRWGVMGSLGTGGPEQRASRAPQARGGIPEFWPVALWWLGFRAVSRSPGNFRTVAPRAAV